MPDRLEPGVPKVPQICELLREAIISLRLEPGAPINEKAICDRLGVSRTPLREAIQILNGAQLVAVLPHSGTFVSRIDLRDVYDAQFIREALERKCGSAAAQSRNDKLERELEFNLFKQKRCVAAQDYDEFFALDEEFHSLICSYGGSPKLWAIVRAAKGQLDRVSRLAFQERTHFKVVLAEHTAIYDAIRSAAPAEADKAMARHLTRVYESIKKMAAQHADLFDVR